MRFTSTADLSTWALASVGLVGLAAPCAAQQAGRQSLSGQAVAEATARAAIPDRFNLRLGTAGFNFEAGLRGEYTDNVFLTSRGTRDDFILVPELKVGAFLPVGQLNSIAADIGIAYYHYFKNDELNTGEPVINPGSEIAFSIYSGDMVLKLSESFHYLESPFYENGGTFYNIDGTGRFARFYNLAGAVATWDLSDWVVTVGYHHENLWANDSVYEYVDRGSELLEAKAMHQVFEGTSVGIEAASSLNQYEVRSENDNWRVRVGPAASIRLSDYLTIRAGGGYERIGYLNDIPTAPSAFTSRPSADTYYAYGELEHVINRFVRGQLVVSHDNQSGANTANLAGTHLRYLFAWTARPQVTVSGYFGVHFYDESYGPGIQTTRDESFTYYVPGLSVAYRWNQHWFLNGSWNYRVKDSDVVAREYDQNLIRLEALYRF